MRVSGWCIWPGPPHEKLPMKRKVWFVLSHLRAGGAERVFWILSQYFDKSKFNVSLVLLDSSDPFFSTDLDGVTIIRLDTIKASRSVVKLCKLVRQEKPEAVFTNGSHLNTLMAFVSLFAPIPLLIGREVNIPGLMASINGSKDMFWDRFVSIAYKRIHIGICQSHEIQKSLSKHYHIAEEKLQVIPNPVIATSVTKSDHPKNKNRLLLIARLAKEKGLNRLLEIMKRLPEEYTLNIAGDGPLKEEIALKIEQLSLGHRVKLLGAVKNVQQLIAEHSLMVLSSFTEGFPNVVLESLSVGVPVVSFRVSGISALIKDDFNGYIVEQDDLEGFKTKIVKACTKDWYTYEIKQDVNLKFGVQKIVEMYQSLLEPEVVVSELAVSS